MFTIQEVSRQDGARWCLVVALDPSDPFRARKVLGSMRLMSNRTGASMFNDLGHWGVEVVPPLQETQGSIFVN